MSEWLYTTVYSVGTQTPSGPGAHTDPGGQILSPAILILVLGYFSFLSSKVAFPQGSLCVVWHTKSYSVCTAVELWTLLYCRAMV